MGAKVFYIVFLLSYIIYSGNATEDFAASTTSVPDLGEELISMDENLKQVVLTVKENTKYNITMKKECINYKLSIAVIEATCVNPSQLKFNERRNAVWNCQSTSTTTRVYDSGTNTLSVRVPEEWGENNATLLITAYFVPSENNDACPGVPENYFGCERCHSPITTDGENTNNVAANGKVTNIQKLRYIHRDLQCNRRINCGSCEITDECNDSCSFNCNSSVWKFHGTQYLITAVVVGLFLAL